MVQAVSEGGIVRAESTKRMKKAPALITALALTAALIISGCGRGGEKEGSGAPPQEIDVQEPVSMPPENIHEVPVATAPGIDVTENDRAIVDFSNTRDGYAMAKYNQKIDKDVRALVVVPDGTQYQFRLTPGGDYSVLPLTGGNGEYTISVWEHVEESKFAQVISVTVDVVLDNEFSPFLRPSQFVNYSNNSAAVRKAAELAATTDKPMDIITVVYNYVISNISYDKELADTVQSGYLPDIDAVMESGKGICFDYSALMAAMLRSQGIPTKMIFGYTGEDYHAWISVYTEETGWIDDVIHFDGVNWNIMDPTFAAGGQNNAVTDYITDSSNYQAKYVY